MGWKHVFRFVLVLEMFSKIEDENENGASPRGVMRQTAVGQAMGDTPQGEGRRRFRPDTHDRPFPSKRACLPGWNRNGTLQAGSPQFFTGSSNVKLPTSLPARFQPGGHRSSNTVARIIPLVAAFGGPPGCKPHWNPTELEAAGKFRASYGRLPDGFLARNVNGIQPEGFDCDRCYRVIS